MRPPSPPAVVIGLDGMTGLQTARLLHRRGVRVFGIASRLKHPCCWTRSVVQTLQAGPEQLTERLLELGPRLQEKAVLIPCTDLSVLEVSRQRTRLERCYEFRLPAAETVELLVDKSNFYRFAQSSGLPIPATFFIRTGEDLQEALGQLQFPCLVKPPVKTPRWEQEVRSKVVRVQTAEELRRFYLAYHSWLGEFVVQEWVEGPDENLFTCNCYFDCRSRPLLSFVTRKVRQWPPLTGTGCLGEECGNETVRQLTLDLFRRLNLQGFGYVEVKRTDRDPCHRIIEPNIGRPTGRSATAEAAGIEFLYTAYCEMAGREVPSCSRKDPRPAKWVYLRRDLQASFYYWTRGQLTLSRWWHSLRGPKAYALFSWTDPGPFLRDLAGAVWAALRGKKHFGPQLPDRPQKRRYFWLPSAPAGSPHGGDRS